MKCFPEPSLYYNVSLRLQDSEHFEESEETSVVRQCGPGETGKCYLVTVAPSDGQTMRRHSLECFRIYLSFRIFTVFLEKIIE